MISNFLLIFTFYYLVLFSVVGFGNCFLKIFFNKEKNLNFGYQGLFGIFFLIIYSYFSSLFYAHSLIHNTVFLIIGLFLFFKFFNNKKREFIISISIFLLIFVSLIIFKTHDDFPYYHFGYSYYLTQNPIMIGAGMFNHGFRTPSSIFYLNSLFYLPLIKFYFFHLASILILGFVNIILIFELLSKSKKNNNNFIFYFSLLSILFINIFFYRIAEHGSDRSAQILVFLFFIEIFIFIYMKFFYDFQLSKILILLAIIISLKAFYVLYIIFLLPLLIHLKKKNTFLKIVKIFLRNPAFYLISLMFSLVMMINLFNSGCLVYPVYFTCIESLSWATPISEVKDLNDWYEQWSKAGATPNFRVENPEIYIQGLNWVDNWFEKYFFNKVSDLLLGIFFMILIIFFVFYSKKNKKLSIEKNIYFFVFVMLILLIEWFYNHPALRYGGYVLVSSIFFIPTAFILSKYSTKKTEIKKRVIIVITISFIIFFSRNISRIYSEVAKYNFKPFIDNSFRISNNHYRLHNQMNDLVNNFEICKKNLSNCDKNLKPEVKKKFNRYIFIRNK